MKLQNIFFNSNFNRRSQTAVSDPNDSIYTLIYDSLNSSDRPVYNPVDVTDATLEKITIYTVKL